MVGIASVWQLSDLVERLVPLRTLYRTLSIEPTTSLSEHLSARENFARREEHLLEDLRVCLLVVLIDRSVIEKGTHVIFDLIKGLLDYVCCWCDEGINLSVRAFTDFEEDNRTFADDLIDH